MKAQKEKAMKFKEYENDAALKKAQSNAIAMLGKGREAVHKMLVETAIHIHKHGDRMGACNIIESLNSAKEGKAVRKKIIGWLVRYAGLEYDDKADSFTGWKGAEYIRNNLKHGKNNPWYKATKEKEEWCGFCAGDAIRKLTEQVASAKKKAEKENAQGKLDLNVRPETLRQLFALLGVDDALAAAALHPLDEQKAAA